MNIMNKTIFGILIILVAITLCCRPTHCKPLEDIATKDEVYNDNAYNGNLDKKTIEQLRQCDRDLETMELCMRCAKITKSTIVYPLCCANEDKIKDWCHDYVFFGVL